MKFRGFPLIICLLFCFATFSHAQSVTGKWYGIGNIAITASTNGYLCEFIIKENGGKVTGEFNYFFRNGYFSNKITGTFNSSTRMLKIKTIPILYHGNVDIANGVDCFMDGEFVFRSSKIETILLGNFAADDIHKFTCAPLNIKFVKQPKDAPTLKEQIAAKPLLIEKQDTILPVLMSKETTPNNPLTINQNKPLYEIIAEKELIKRSNQLFKELDVVDDSVRIDLYDNGEYDKDSISLFYNGKLRVYREELKTRTPISLYVNVDSVAANNTLVMFAENLGEIPPNAALMIVTDSQNRYEVNINANYLKNGAVRLKKIPKQK